MITSAFELITDFLSNMEVYWGGNQRQLKKSIGRVNRMRKFHAWTNADLARQMAVLADQRLAKKSRTLYLSSFGSSGSHLIQYALSMTASCLPLGEVYLAPRLELMLQELSDEEKYKSIEMYHLVHSTAPEWLTSQCAIINTAHRAKLQVFSECTYEFSSAFIFRDPVQLALSRAFRKGEYRNYLGKESTTDLEYLTENIEKTIKFYELALRYDYDEFLFFEDVQSNRDRLAESLSNLLGAPMLKDEFNSNLLMALDNGSSTNKFSGEDKSDSGQYLEYTTEKLTPLISKINEKLEERQISSVY